MTSLPVPLSPSISTVVSSGAAWRSCASNRSMATEWLIIIGSPARALMRSRRSAISR